jgi:hypothetical protein
MTADPATPTGTCRVCGQVLPLSSGFVVNHGYLDRARHANLCKGSGDVSREYSEAHTQEPNP